jgi:hypothetical protein
MVREAKERSAERIRKAETCGKRDKSLSNHENFPESFRESSAEIPGEKPEARSQKPRSQEAAAVAAAVPPDSGRAAPAAPPGPVGRDLTAAEWAQPDPTVEAHRLVDRLMQLHPKPGNAQLAQAALARILAGAANMAGVCADIERKHSAWVAYWSQLPRSAFRPMLHKWFSDGDYLHAPAIQAKEDGVQW